MKFHPFDYIIIMKTYEQTLKEIKKAIAEGKSPYKLCKNIELENPQTPCWDEICKLTNKL